MANVVFVLGAGASKPAGAPIMNNFIKIASELHRRGKFRTKGQHFETVARIRGELQRVHSKAQLDLDNIEQLFSALEMAQMLRWLPGLENEDIDAASTSLKHVIVDTLAASIQYPEDGKGKMMPPHAYGSFCSLIKTISREEHPTRSVAIITFNYDVALDYSLQFHRLGPDYCLGSGAPRENNGIPLLKLHGSVNWGKCQQCGKVVPFEIKDYFGPGPQYAKLASNVYTFDITERLSMQSHCDKPISAEPVLIPPTWNKATSHTLFPEVWVRAGQELRDAQSVYVIGYSLPASDEFFHYLFAVGAAGRSLLDRFVVIDPAAQSTIGSKASWAQQRIEYFMGGQRALRSARKAF
jgi:hypothetical protein